MPFDFRPEIAFFIEGLAPRPHALVPTLQLGLRVVNGSPVAIHSMLVRCQIQIDPARRRYTPEEQTRLAALFSTPERWGETLRPLHWQQVTALIGGFTATVVAEVELPCSFDFDLAATQYFEALPEGDLPLRVLFSGTVFYAGEQGVQAAPLDWNLEARYRMPAAAWRDCVGAHYPDCAWLRLRRETFLRLQRHHAASGHLSWEQTVEALLAAEIEAHASLGLGGPQAGVSLSGTPGLQAGLGPAPINEVAA